MPEVPVLERPGEEGRDTACRGTLLQCRALGPEADDDETGTETGQRVDQDMDALLLDQLAEVDDDGSLRAKEGSSRVALPPSGSRSSAFQDSGGSRRASSSRSASAASRDCGTHSSMSTPGGTSTTFSVWPQTSAKTLRMCSEPTNVPGRRAANLPPRRETRVAAHRVLELGTVCLDCEWCSGGGPDRAAEKHVVREHDIGRQERPERGGVRLDPVVELLARTVLHAAHVVAVIAVEDEDRQQAPDVGSQDAAEPRS